MRYFNPRISKDHYAMFCRILQFVESTADPMMILGDK